jgi:hypothetical protein
VLFPGIYLTRNTPLMKGTVDRLCAKIFNGVSEKVRNISRKENKLKGR